MDSVVERAVDAIARHDWDGLTFLLHPYLHWTDGEVRLRGRRNVLAHLAAQPDVRAPREYELRDGQIYRWTAR